jgi:hypothetical protein
MVFQFTFLSLTASETWAGGSRDVLIKDRASVPFDAKESSSIKYLEVLDGNNRRIFQVSCDVRNTTRRGPHQTLQQAESFEIGQSASSSPKCRR